LDFVEAHFFQCLHNARRAVPLVQHRDALPIGLRNGLQRWKIEMVRMLVGNPDVFDSLDRNLPRGAVERTAIVDDFPLGPGIAPNACACGLKKEASVIDKCEFHGSYASTALAASEPAERQTILAAEDSNVSDM